MHIPGLVPPQPKNNRTPAQIQRSQAAANARARRKQLKPPPFTRKKRKQKPKATNARKAHVEDVIKEIRAEILKIIQENKGQPAQATMAAQARHATNTRRVQAEAGRVQAEAGRVQAEDAMKEIREEVISIIQENKDRQAQVARALRVDLHEGAGALRALQPFAPNLTRLCLGYDGGGQVSCSINQNYVEKALKEGSFAFIATLRDYVVGYAIGRVEVGTVWISIICTSGMPAIPGVGTCLMKEIYNYARAIGIDHVSVTSNDNPGTLRFFQKQGFVRQWNACSPDNDMSINRMGYDALNKRGMPEHVAQAAQGVFLLTDVLDRNSAAKRGYALLLSKCLRSSQPRPKKRRVALYA